MHRRRYGLLLAGPAIVFGCDLKLVADPIQHKVDVCHVPPGNPCAAQNIEVKQSDVEAHLAHGDHKGACTGVEGLEVETCDGADNDCDGNTDEDCAECMDYATCTKKPANGALCMPGPSEECNGIDDDCDGFVDDGCDDQCMDYDTCQTVQSSGTCAQAPEENCDDKDNDCDGSIDESCSDCGGTSSLSIPCKCTNYTTCAKYDSADPCPAPPVEICDGKDNDCDGLIDPACKCIDFTTCQQLPGTQPCPTTPAEICDGKDNDCDGVVDPGCPDDDCDEQQIGKPCNVGQVCKSGVWTCTSGKLECLVKVQLNDLDGDGIADAQDPDDDGDGIPDVSDEFPKAISVVDTTIDFDVTPGGSQLVHNELLAEQFAAKGVHFASQYRIARRLVAFPCYNGTPTLNVLCTPVGASGGMCTGPGSNELVINLDMQVDYASLEFRTRCDGVYDGDMGTFTGITATSTVPNTVVVTNAAPFPNEGMIKAVVHSPGIQQLRVNPGDFDSLDTLRLVKLKAPCQ